MSHTKWELGVWFQPASVSVCFCLLPSASLGSCSADSPSSWQPDLPEARQPNATSHRARLCPGLALNHFHTCILQHHPPSSTLPEKEPFVLFCFSIYSYICFSSGKSILMLQSLQLEMLILKNMVTLLYTPCPLWDLLQLHISIPITQAKFVCVSPLSLSCHKTKLSLHLAVMRAKTYWWMQLRDVLWKLRHTEHKGLLLALGAFFFFLNR